MQRVPGCAGLACSSAQRSVHPNTATQQPGRALQRAGRVLQLVEILGRVNNMETNKAVEGSERGGSSASSDPTRVSPIPSGDAASLQKQIPCLCSACKHKLGVCSGLATGAAGFKPVWQ